jgi:hypothetical protein
MQLQLARAGCPSAASEPKGEDVRVLAAVPSSEALRLRHAGDGIQVEGGHAGRTPDRSQRARRSSARPVSSRAARRGLRRGPGRLEPRNSQAATIRLHAQRKGTGVLILGRELPLRQRFQQPRRLVPEPDHPSAHIRTRYPIAACYLDLQLSDRHFEIQDLFYEGVAQSALPQALPNERSELMHLDDVVHVGQAIPSPVCIDFPLQVAAEHPACQRYELVEALEAGRPVQGALDRHPALLHDLAYSSALAFSELEALDKDLRVVAHRETERRAGGKFAESVLERSEAHPSRTSVSGIDSNFGEPDRALLGPPPHRAANNKSYGTRT